MYNPFLEISDDKNIDYIERSIQGDKKALEALILQHQSWIFNIAFNMTSDFHYAEDITQEVLLKVITKLSTYNSKKASFRTWLYRIVVNHIINMKENRREQFFLEMAEQGDYNDYIAHQPDTRKSFRPEYNLMKEETKFACTLCLLLCLTRKERIVFILGVLFNVTDQIGAEICDVSKENFRKILSRSRKKIFNFFNQNCSLLNESNPCKCREQTSNLIKAGIIDPNDYVTNQSSHGRIRDVLDTTIKNIEDSYYEFITLFRDQPFLKGPDMVQWLRDLLKRNEFNNIFFEGGHYE